MLGSTSNLCIHGAVSRAGKVVGQVAQWLKDGHLPPQAVLGLIEGYMHRVACPVYLGAISLYIGWSLARTQEMMTILQDRGIVVPLAPEEKKKRGFRDDANVFVLTEPPHPSKAKW
jgi:hypothetical protein